MKCPLTDASITFLLVNPLAKLRRGQLIDVVPKRKMSGCTVQDSDMARLTRETHDLAPQHTLRLDALLSFMDWG